MRVTILLLTAGLLSVGCTAEPDVANELRELARTAERSGDPVAYLVERGYTVEFANKLLNDPDR